jgi:hypothetical protein
MKGKAPSTKFLDKSIWNPSQIELNRPMKGVSFRRVNHAELKLPPWAKVRGLGGRIFWPKAGILVRCRSLGVKGFMFYVEVLELTLYDYIYLVMGVRDSKGEAGEP